MCSSDVLMQWQGRYLVLCILSLLHQVPLAFGLYQIADERIVAFPVLDRDLACKKKKLRLRFTGKCKDTLRGAVIHLCRPVSGREQLSQDLLGHRAILGPLVYEVLGRVLVIGLCL